MAVKIYTTPTCIYCKKTKEYLKQNKIEFEEIDVSSSQDAAKQLIALSGQIGVPVLDINGDIILGFDKEKIKTALEI